RRLRGDHAADDVGGRAAVLPRARRGRSAAERGDRGLRLALAARGRRSGKLPRLAAKARATGPLRPLRGHLPRNGGGGPPAGRWRGRSHTVEGAPPPLAAAPRNRFPTRAFVFNSPDSLFVLNRRSVSCLPPPTPSPVPIAPIGRPVTTAGRARASGCSSKRSPPAIRSPGPACALGCRARPPTRRGGATRRSRASGRPRRRLAAAPPSRPSSAVFPKTSSESSRKPRRRVNFGRHGFFPWTLSGLSSRCKHRPADEVVRRLWLLSHEIGAFRHRRLGAPQLVTG